MISCVLQYKHITDDVSDASLTEKLSLIFLPGRLLLTWMLRPPNYPETLSEALLGLLANYLLISPKKFCWIYDLKTTVSCSLPMRSEVSWQIVLVDLCSVCLSEVQPDNEGATKEFLSFVSLVAVYYTLFYKYVQYTIQQSLKYDFYILSTGHIILLFNCSVIIFNLELKPCCETLINQMTGAARRYKTSLLGVLLVLNVTVLLIKAKLIQTTHTRRKSRCTWEKVQDQHDVGHV